MSALIYSFGDMQINLNCVLKFLNLIPQGAQKTDNMASINLIYVISN